MEVTAEENGNHNIPENGTDPEAGAPGGEKRSLSFTRVYRIPYHKPQVYTTAQTLLLAYQSLGVVYGDIGTSPLYVFSSITLPNPGEKDLLGILSIIFWTLTLMGLIKYVFIVLHADDHGEGGTFALFSLLRQHINFGSKTIIPNMRLPSDLNLKFHSDGSSLQTKTKQFLENSKGTKNVVTFIVLIGTCMVIGDGALTPAISVLSAVQGIQSRSSKITQDHVVIISVVILLALFLFQRFGTSKVSFSFSPIMLLWFVFTAAIGVYNIIKYYPPVFKALSPHYIPLYFIRNKTKGWELLGAIALCITGAEAMFADLGHFNKHGIQIAFSSVVYPSLILAYSGEAAYLIKHPENISTTFYSSVPSPVFWPMFIVSTLAAVVASQALISASFSIVRQSMALSCFPRVKMIHTSNKHEGQVYSPEVNYFLMIVCLAITVGFKGGPEIGNAFGVAVIWVMLITTWLITVVMLVVWDTNIVLVLVYISIFTVVEGVYMTSLMNKIPNGGWVPFAISAFLLVITLSWTYGRRKKARYEAERKISASDFNQMVTSTNLARVPGLCFFCTDLINGIPPIIPHYMKNVGTLREIMVIITVRILPIKAVLPKERYVVAKLGPNGVYRCLAQYGYTDNPDMNGEEFIASVTDALKEIVESPEEIDALEDAVHREVVFILGRIILKTSKKGGCFSRFVIDNLYRFLQKNFRSTVDTFQIPPAKVLQVGMLYEI